MDGEGFSEFRYDATDPSCPFAAFVTDQAVGSNAKDRERLRAMLARAQEYSNKTEHCFSKFLPLALLRSLMVPTMVSRIVVWLFSNNYSVVPNAAGPLFTIYLIWSSGNFSGSCVLSRRPHHRLGHLGLYYHGTSFLNFALHPSNKTLQSVLGNRITLHSLSYGYTRESGGSHNRRPRLIAPSCRLYYSIYLWSHRRCLYLQWRRQHYQLENARSGPLRRSVSSSPSCALQR